LTVYPRENSSDEDYAITKLAVARKSMFTLVNENIMTYQELGVPTYKGALPWHVIQEHIIIRNFTIQARAQKRAQNG
jgi:hypothetical protein